MKHNRQLKKYSSVNRTNNSRIEIVSTDILVIRFDDCLQCDLTIK